MIDQHQNCAVMTIDSNQKLPFIQTSVVLFDEHQMENGLGTE
jgi:hypothetical protein